MRFDGILGTISAGMTVNIFWTICFGFEMPVGAYSIDLYVIGEPPIA
ncbi:MAG: hypothetical protein RTV72_15290 [Candidatus Thorarchaeota archaeon]